MKANTTEIGRYIVNGVAATLVHYGVLAANLNLLGFDSAGLANFVAALFGITASFLGSRYFVFRRTSENIVRQALKFSGLYGLIAIVHGLFLTIWTDWNGLNYHLGFLAATAIQVSLSYVGNKILVFRT